MDDERFAGLLAGKTVVKVIAVPDKLVNIVIKGYQRGTLRAMHHNCGWPFPVICTMVQSGDP